MRTATKPRAIVGRIHAGKIVVVTKREDGVIELRFPKSVEPYAPEAA